VKLSVNFACAAAIFTVSIPAAADAQIEPNFASIGQVVAGLTVPLVLNPCNADLPGGCHASDGHRSVPAQAMARPAPHGGTVPSLHYAATPAFRQKALAGLVGRLRAKNPEAAQSVQAAFAHADYARIYDGIVAPYGLAGDDTANALAAYLVLGWMIANGQQDVPAGKASALATRAQVAATLSANRQITPDGRAALGEEMKILFVVAHSGWQGSLRDGSARAYADGVARQFQQQFGIDLRHSRIDATGLHQG